MSHSLRRVIVLAFCLMLLAVPLAVFADSTSVDFESYTVGNIHGQDGWSKTGAYDVAVVANSFGFPTFGGQSLRISNAVTSGSFGDQTFAKPLADAVGETTATTGGFPEGTRQNHFEMQFDIASTQPTEQSGLAISVSPDRGDGSRMSYLKFADTAGGIDVTFFDVQQPVSCTPSGCANFVPTVVATGLSRTPHTIKLTMDTLDGPSNDVVKVYIDGTLVKTGGSWEDYYRNDPEAGTEQSPRIVKTVLFRAGGTAVPATAGNGFVIDNLTTTSSTVLPCTTDCYVDAATGSDGNPGTAALPFKTIQKGVNTVVAGGTVNVAAGTYNEDVSVNKQVSLLGAGAATTSIVGPIGGDGTTVKIDASNATVAGFTITRAGNNVTDWNGALNLAGIAIQGQAFTGDVIRDNIITGNRTAIDINNSNGHTIRNNVIDFNRTGLVFRNQTDNLTIVENNITNNWTVGVLFLDASGGTNIPVQTAANCNISNNNISGNWYGQIVDRQAGGSLLAPGANLKNFSGNWFGTVAPVVSTANSSEPGYAAQIPVLYGGSAVPPPAAQPDILGPASANFDFTPYLGLGTDTNVETTAGRGTNGFQGDFSSLYVTAAGAQTGTDSRIKEGVNLVAAGGTVNVTAGTYPSLSTITFSKGMKLLGAGAASTFLKTSLPGGFDLLDIAADNVTIQGFDIEKTDKPGEQRLIAIHANNATVKNNTLHGQWVPGDGDVSRAIATWVGGWSGLLIEGNTIYGLRNSYISGPVYGDVKNNLTYGTRGWVLESGNLTFTNNTWGSGNAVDIAIISIVPATYYTDIMAMSAANNNAVIEDQRTSPAKRSIIYVNAGAPAGGKGGQLDPFTDLNSAWTSTGTPPSPIVAPGGKIMIVGSGVYNVAAGAHPGGIEVTANNVKINLNGATIGHGSPALTVSADDVSLLGPGALDGLLPPPNFPAVLVNSGADNFTLDGVEILNWREGVLLDGSHASLKLVNSWLHDNGNGFHFNSNTALSGVVTINGNLFKFNNYNGIWNESAGTIPAEYNAWGDIDGSAVATGGDGVSGLVDADPFSFVEVFTDAAITPMNVVEGHTFDVKVQADAAGMYAVQYKLTYDATLLQFQGMTNGVFGSCTTNTATAGVITAYCPILNGGPDINATAALVNKITFKVAPDSSHASDDSWTTYLDLKHNDGLAAAARDGIKAWVNNAGFGAASSTAKDITDAKDGTIIIAGLANYTGYIDLQGRTNDSGAKLGVFDVAAKATATELANATSASSGAYTTSYVTGFELAVGTVYYFQVDRDLYLPTTRTFFDSTLPSDPAPTDWADFKLLDNRPLTTLQNVVLLGGDADNNNKIEVNDATCIGNNYGGPAVACTVSPTSADVTGDGKVDILDLTLMGGNYNKSSSPWAE